MFHSLHWMKVSINCGNGDTLRKFSIPVALPMILCLQIGQSCGSRPDLIPKRWWWQVFWCHGTNIHYEKYLQVWRGRQGGRHCRTEISWLEEPSSQNTPAPAYNLIVQILMNIKSISMHKPGTREQQAVYWCPTGLPSSSLSAPLSSALPSS